MQPCRQLKHVACSSASCLTMRDYSLFALQRVVVDDLGMEDVDEFEAELAALDNAKLT